MSRPPGRIRVLVVDDSVVIRKIVTEALAADPDLEVVGTAADGRAAVRKVSELAPDVVTMDIEMPVMDGIEAVRAIRRTQPALPIVMFSTLTERGAAATLDALAAGATDYVQKPSNVGSIAQGRQDIRDQLVPRLKALTGRRPAAAAGVRALVPRPAVPAGGPRRPRSGPFGVLAIGSSTGGPDALARMLPALPAHLPVPVVVVQHMPPLFTRLLAQRLDAQCALTVVEAAEGEPIVPGTVVIAPGGTHLVVRRQGATLVARLTLDPPENFCRPAVDVLFRSVASVFGDRALACVLTGMGRDGEKGAGVVRAAGGEVVVQDEATSVVWGMPGAVAGAGFADRVLPLDRIGHDLAAALHRGHAPVGVRS